MIDEGGREGTGEWSIIRRVRSWFSRTMRLPTSDLLANAFGHRTLSAPD